ncbi:hypothetical protein ABEB22_18440 (plasmid) [Thioclava sp. 'Guangxiensis']|uniref:hypothetical protein n=1 Tax=Thioclava sp. 'Guangxiensis' TaxID=3149044 RepID=UPI0032C41670
MSNFDAVIGRVIEGAKPSDIAVEQSLSIETVYLHSARARKLGLPMPQKVARKPRLGRERVTVSRKLLEGLGSHSAARGLTESELASRILEAVIFGHGIDALLPHGGPHA